LSAKEKPFRICAIDTSFTSPGFAVIEVRERKAKLIEMTSFKTDTTESYVTRGRHIEAFTHLFLRKHRPFDILVRESFPGKFQRTNYPVFSAWHAVDRAAAELGYAVTEDLSPSRVKEEIGGSGSAKKPVVADGVRQILGSELEFNSGYDDSDACAIALTWLIMNGMIDAIHEPKPKKPRKKKTKGETG
jgi:crossover junction endodeoxyribonuclease RuvC